MGTFPSLPKEPHYRVAAIRRECESQSGRATSSFMDEEKHGHRQPTQAAIASMVNEMTSRPSRLGRILRLQVREDQLTEIVALLLESDTGLACRAIEHLTMGQIGPSRQAHISTQRTETLGEIDLEIDWRDGLVWVEVKRDMPGESRPNQLRDYYTALQERAAGRDCALVYLTKAGV